MARIKILNNFMKLIWFTVNKIAYFRGGKDPHKIIYALRRLVDQIPMPPVKAIVRFIAYDNINGYWIPYKDVKTERVILYLHGGAYVFRLINIYKYFAYQLSVASHTDVFLLNYRVAPENVFPAPLQDSLAAYQYLLNQGYRSDQIIIGGDSAGGGLAMSTLIALRDARKCMPAAYVGISPWFDLALTGASVQSNKEKDFVVQGLQDWIQDWVELYLAGANPLDPLVSPLYANITELPPLFIQVGENEVLLDDALRFRDKALQGGVTMHLEVGKNMPHDWHLFSRYLPEGKRAIEGIGKYIQSL